MKNILSLCISVVFFCHPLFAREKGNRDSLIVESHSVLSTDQVPFWLEVNRLGRVDDGLRVQQIVVAEWQGFVKSRNEKFLFSYGTSLAGRLGQKSDAYMEQYWGKIQAGKFFLHLGARGEPVWGEGLSHTNGDLFLSNNARPQPRIEFGFEKYNPLSSGLLSRFSLDFRYAEYFMLDDRHVDDTNLHHKRIMINYRSGPSLTFSAGIDHWVFWGGTSPEYGKMPGCGSYFKYIFAQSGGYDSPQTDQLNSSGNSLGQYLFQVDFKQPDYEVKFYCQHLFEDKSGVRFANTPDGFLGISLTRLKGKPLVKSAVLEYVFTKDQSGSFHGTYQPDPGKPDYITRFGMDNYFNHGVYKSGFVSYNRMIGSPLFIPNIENGRSTGFESNRLWAIHGGMAGYLNGQVYWSGRATYSKHYGTHAVPFDHSLNLLSLEADCRFHAKKQPIAYIFKIATDMGDYLKDSWGLEFSLRYRIR